MITTPSSVLRLYERAINQRQCDLAAKFEMPRERDICCGSAGTCNLLEPEAGRELGERKAHNVLAADAQLLVTANPGCHLQIQASLRRLGRNLPAAHVMELVDASIRGASSDTLGS